jgi:1-acyl-sn-glycerol-3-phosphate acyltransferase
MKKTFDTIVGALLALWGSAMFLFTMLVFWIPIWLLILVPEPERTRRFIPLSRIWMRFFFILSGLRLTVKGREHFAPGENYVVVCNHNSFMDVPLSSPFIPGPNKTIAKHEFVKVPLFGLIYRRGSVLVNRKSEKSRKESYQAMRKVLESGMHMCIYPEGTRNRTGEHLKTFHDGAFKLAVSTGKAIIPAIIFHTGKVLPANRPFYFRPKPIGIHFLEPVNVDEQTDPQELKERVYRIMWDYLESRKLGNGYYRL